MPSEPTPEEILFDEALSVPAAERAAFLRARCTENPGLLASLDALLRAHEAADALDQSLAQSLHGELRHHGESGLNLTGSSVGPYQIAEQLGEGGTGIVYRAEQTEPIHRAVALKVIKPGMDTREVLARFAAERQALARMDHPGIARVIDAGSTVQGRSYFVMELVRGEPITRYCDAHGLDLAARLALFAQVCHAVQHAHQKGIIHRDLKPSNLLVVQTDGEARPKVIDFGIAKAVARDAASADNFITQVSQFVGTPGYMSPEQAAGDLDLDTRSDLYSLGVVLYELLTGRTPHEVRDWAKTGIDELRRRIREEEPLRPSTAVERLDPEAALKLAVTRNVAPARLAAELRGDLDWIVLRCLEKDRARRYASAAELAEDLRRYRDHEPVAAAAPGRWYVLGKSLRRHRLGYALGGVAVLALAGATAVSVSLAVRAQRAEREAAEKAEISQAVTDFLRLDVLAQASPEKQPDREMKIRTALDNAAEKIGDRFARQPLTEASVRETLGDTYNALGDFAAALKHYERAWALRKEHLGPEARPTLIAQNLVLRGLRQLARFDEAERLAGDALAQQLHALGRRDVITLETMAGLGAMRLEQGRHAEARGLLTEVLALRREVLGPEHLKTLQSMNNLAMCYSALGEEEAAIALSEESLAIRRRIYGPEHPFTLSLLNNLASSYSRSGAIEKASAVYREIYDIRKRVQGPDHPDTLNTLQNLGSDRVRQGLRDEAAELLLEAYAGLVRTLGAEHPQTTMPLMNLGVLRTEQGRFEEAEAYLRQCWDLRRKQLGPDHHLSADTATQFAETIGHRGRTEEAEAIFRTTLAQRTAAHGADGFRTLTTANAYGRFLLTQGRLEEGSALLLDTANRAIAALGMNHVMIADYTADAMQGLLLTHRAAAAEALGSRVLAAIGQKRAGLSARWLLEARLGAARLALGQTAEAEPALVAGYAGMERLRARFAPIDAVKFDEVQRCLVELYTRQGRTSEVARWQALLAKK